MTDTPTRADLIERLRSVDVSWSEVGEWCAEAADLIETQAREIERLRVALGKIARETTKVIPELINQQMCIDAVNAHARAALKGTDNDPAQIEGQEA